MVAPRTPKTSPDGRGRLSPIDGRANPIRSMGERETRGSVPGINTDLFLSAPNADFDGNLLGELQEAYRQGDLTDYEQNSASGRMAMIDDTNLSGAEYFNRKQQIQEHLQAVENMPREVLDPKAIFEKLFSQRQLTAEEHRYVYMQYQYTDQIAPGLIKSIDEFGNESSFDHKEIEKLRFKLTLAQKYVFADKPNYGYDVDTFTGRLMMPYDSCMFVLPRFGGGVFIALVEQLRDDQILISGVYKARGENRAWEPCRMKARVHLTAGKIKQYKVGVDEVLAEQSLKERTAQENLFIKATRAILAFVDGLDKKVTVTVKPTLVAPTAGETKLEDALNVVYMKGIIVKPNEPLGGTHASPREHDREAHWRTRNGKKHRVKATIVNKGVGGRIYKEYHIQ